MTCKIDAVDGKTILSRLWEMALPYCAPMLYMCVYLFIVKIYVYLSGTQIGVHKL